MSLRERCAAVIAEASELDVAPVEAGVDPEVHAIDEATNAAETAEVAVTIDSELAEARRLEDTAMALEDLTVVEETVTEATPTDLLLVETAARLAAAGSDMTVEEVIPGLEGYAGKKISMENIKQLAANIWAALLNMLRRIWARVEHFYQLFVAGCFGVKRAVERYKAKLAELDSNKKPSEEKITLGYEVNALRRNGKNIKDATDLTLGVTATATMVNFFTDEYLKTVEANYHAITAATGNFKAGAVKESLQAIVEADTGKMWALPNKLGHNPVKHPAFAPGEYYQSDEMPGGYVAVARDAKKGVLATLNSTLKKDDPLAAADAITKSGVQFKRLPDAPNKDTNMEMRIMTAAEMKKVIDLIDAIVTDAANYSKAGKARIMTARDQLIKASDKLANETKSLADKQDEMRYVRAALSFNTYLTQAATQPVTSCLSAAMTVCRNTLIVVRRNMAVYA